MKRNNFGDLCVCFYKIGIKAASLIYFLINDLIIYINLFSVNAFLLVTYVNFGEISLVLELAQNNFGFIQLLHRSAR